MRAENYEQTPGTRSLSFTKRHGLLSSSGTRPYSAASLGHPGRPRRPRWSYRNHERLVRGVVSNSGNKLPLVRCCCLAASYTPILDPYSLQSRGRDSTG